CALPILNSILSEKVVELSEKTRLVEVETMEVEAMKRQIGDMENMMQKMIGSLASQWNRTREII
ncbi:MAG: hypothetical protein QG670_2786, partial [Thermoproteota archaeon]|nr:hypothetical protein [Thermoproteota archaeon]